jgi:hypothetical protein
MRSPAKSVCRAVKRSTEINAFLAAEMRERTELGGNMSVEMPSSSMASLTRLIWSDESAIENRGGSCASRCRRRRNRRHHEWNVPTNEPRAALPASARARSRISPAALFVKVTAAIDRGSAPERISRASRCVMTRVLPEPAPASTRRGPLSWRTAWRCSGLSLSIRGSADTGGSYRPAIHSTVTDFARFRG